MVTKFRSWLKQAQANLNRIGNEPILAVGLAIEFFLAYQEGSSNGLQPEDAAAFGVVAVLTLLGRQLVYPATKVDAATGALKPVEPPLEKPYAG